MNDKKGIRLMTKILMIAICPLAVLTVLIVALASNSMKSGLQEEFLNGLRNEAIAAKAFYAALDGGDFRLNDQGELMKGNLNVTANSNLIDSIVSDTDIAVTLFYGDVRKATTLIDAETGNRIVGTTASEAVAKAVLSGDEYSATSLVINKEPYMAYYIPMKNSDGKIVGMFFAGAPSVRVQEFISSRMTQLFLIAGICLIVSIVVCAIVVRIIVMAIKKTDEAINHIADGKLDMRIDQNILERKDEIGEMGRSMDRTGSKLRSIITSISGSTAELKKAGVQLDEMADLTSKTVSETTRAVDGISDGAVTQAQETEKATRLISEMGDLIEHIVKRIQALRDATSEVDKASREARQYMIKLQEYNERTTSEVGRVADNVQKTDKSVNAIAVALDMITAIARETNLLSLNASIEAARAGEAGRGFAVVATEIQKLAEESSDSANKIERIIRTLSQDSSEALGVMENVKEEVSAQQQMMATAMGKFTVVEKGINEVNDHTVQIHSEANKCDAARESVVEIVQNLSALSEENAATSEETTASMEELSEMVKVLADAAGKLQKMAGSLEKDMSFFKI